MRIIRSAHETGAVLLDADAHTPAVSLKSNWAGCTVSCGVRAGGGEQTLRAEVESEG